MDAKPTTQEPTEQCEYCKKRIDTGRLSISYLWKDALNNLFNLERGLFFTFWSMLKSPSAVTRAFVEGDRHRFMNPFRFLLVAATFTVILEALAGDANMFTLLDMKGTDESSAKIVGDVMKKYLNIVILATVPFYAIGSWIVFRKPKWNLAEHLVVNCYAISMIVMLSSLFSLVVFPLDDSIRVVLEPFTQLLNFFLAVVYIATWSYRWWKGVLLMLLSFVIANIFAILAAIGVMTAYVKLIS